FNRWDAGQQFATDIMLDMVKDIQAGKETKIPAAFTQALKGYLNDDNLDKAFIAKAFILPSERAVAERMDVVDVDAIAQARAALRKHIATELKDDLQKVYENNQVKGEYVPNAEDSGKRAVKNMALGYLSILDDSLALKQYYSAEQMTDKDAAVRIFAGKDTPEAKAVMEDFYQTYKKDSLVVDKWLSMQALASADSLKTVKELMTHEAFSMTNPNKVRALINAFAANPTALHKKDGSGYDFIAEQTIAVDKINPQVAAQIPVALGNWKKFDPERQEMMKKALTRIIETPDLSPNTYEIVSKSLGISEKKERQNAADFLKDPGVKRYSNGSKSVSERRTKVSLLAAARQASGR
ncbi:MAG: aminopeptidase N C-terminal domain-containing protein, partial [Alphaproteobacteria bacterium]|nr:aminopeptidase N C-terminal domain-containing protein [Alphaproteobacteria bacterium]